MFQKDWRNIKLDKNLHWYELCFYGDEDSESKNYVVEKACSFVIMEVSEDEANFFDIEGLTKRIENEYGIYYVRA